MLRKLQLTLALLSFLRRYPGTQIIGGPTAFAWLGSRHSQLPDGYFSQCGQDAFLSSRFAELIAAPAFPKIFVDVGCNHPLTHNNSHHFEKHLGFKVLAIDALPTHQKAWNELRPLATMDITAVGQEEGVVEFEEVDPAGRGGDMFSSVSGASGKAPTLGRRLRQVPVAPLSTILKRHGITSVGIMSIDIEGYEMQALQGIDFEACRIEIIILENNSDDVMGNDRIREFLMSRGYRFVARIWAMDDVFIHPQAHNRHAGSA
jgi:FkbM family methyltransferase